MLQWHVVPHHDPEGEPPRADAGLPFGIAPDKALVRRIARQRHPGMIMMLTETSLAPHIRSTDDFVILNTDDA